MDGVISPASECRLHVPDRTAYISIFPIQVKGSSQYSHSACRQIGSIIDWPSIDDIRTNASSCGHYGLPHWLSSLHLIMKQQVEALVADSTADFYLRLTTAATSVSTLSGCTVYTFAIISCFIS
jgi:hypothetical protein